MKRKSIVLATALLIAASSIIAYAMPGIGYLNVNGVRLEYVFSIGKPRVHLVQRGHNELFLKGAVCATPDDIAKAEAIITDWDTTSTVYGAVIMEVDFDAPRNGFERYLITYKRTGGIIDAALLSSDQEWLILSNEIAYADSIRYRNSAKDQSIEMRGDSVVVNKKFNVNVTLDSLTIDVEDCFITMNYAIDKNGKIHRNPDTGVVMLSKRALFKKEDGRWTRQGEVTEHSDFKTLRPDGLTLLLAITEPVSGTPALPTVNDILAKVQARETGEIPANYKRLPANLSIFKKELLKWKVGLEARK